MPYVIGGQPFVSRMTSEPAGGLAWLIKHRQAVTDHVRDPREVRLTAVVPACTFRS
jgi:hypothetical protein